MSEQATIRFFSTQKDTSAGHRSSDEGEFLRPYNQLLPDIVTSEICLTRAIELANEIYNALEKQGHRVMFAPPDRKMQRPSIEERERTGKD